MEAVAKFLAISLALHMAAACALFTVGMSDDLAGKGLAVEVSLLDGGNGGTGMIRGDDKPGSKKAAARVKSAAAGCARTALHADRCAPRNASKPLVTEDPDGRAIRRNALRFIVPDVPPGGFEGAGGTIRTREAGAVGEGADGPDGGGTPGTLAGRGTADGSGFGRFGEGGGPKILAMARPRYPALARRRGIAGRVLLCLSIRKDGSLCDVKVVESAGYGMDESAIEAVRRSRFGPATRNGVPVDCRALLPVRFKLTMAGG